MDDVWAEAAAYERYVGRWSRPVGAQFLDWLGCPADLDWLDVGCGSGALTSQILDQCSPQSILGIDRSAQFVEWAASHVLDERATFVAGDAMQLPSRVADVAVSGLVLNFVPDASEAVASMRSATREGLVAAYVWDYSGRMEMMRSLWDAAVALDAGAVPLAERTRFPMCRPDVLEEMWRAAGLVDVESTAIDVPTVFRDFDDYWLPFLGGQGPAPAYVMSLDVPDRERLRDHLRSQLPTQSDGSISLAARAWAVRGRSTT